MQEPVSIERLEKAIRIWEEMNSLYKENMANIKSNRRFTWWLSPTYWRNESKFHKGFTALIRRRIQLQTALKERNS